MIDYKKNPIFKQLLTEISSKASTGRINTSWGKIEEAKKKKLLKTEANDETKKPNDSDEESDEKNVPSKPRGPGSAFSKTPDASSGTGSDDSAGDGTDTEKMPSFGGGEPPSGDSAPEAPSEKDSEKGGEEDSGEDVDKAKEDALAAQAELEKAKAEKGDAEKELEKQSYIHLVSPGGVSFLLGKLVDHAFKTNTIDSLAAEMVQKLKIQTQEEYKLFSDEMIPFKNIPGVVDLLTSMQGLVGKQTPPA